MLCTVTFHVEPPYLRSLAAAGLDSFQVLMHGEVGDCFKRKAETEVRRLVVPTDSRSLTMYLKRSLRSQPDKTAHSLLRGRRPHVRCIREMLAVLELHRRDMPVMTPVAWGERCLLGLPREGFFLVEQVEGRDLIEVFNEIDVGGRGHLCAKLGHLIGDLNAMGFYQPLRLHDLMVAGLPDDSPQIVMIDREATRPQPRPFQVSRCIDCLAKCYCKNLTLMRPPLTLREWVQAGDAYCRQLKPHWRPSRRQLLQRVGRRVQQLSGRGQKYECLNAQC